MNEKVLERFCEACGLSSPLVLECQGPGESAAIVAKGTFDRPFVVVGRDPGSDLFLNDGAVSKHHVFLQVIAGRLFAIDLESRTKVTWEGDAGARSRGWLDSGRFIQVGPYRIRRIGCDTSEDRQAALPAPPASFSGDGSESSPMPRAALELPLRVGSAPALWPVNGPLAVVGRSDECDLVLSDDTISRFHAALVPTRVGLWVVDLLAREGVRVNGKRVRWAWLAAGDTVRIGRFTFILQYKTSPQQINRQDMPLEAGASLPKTPGTALAVRTRRSDNGRIARIPQPKNASPAPLKAARSVPSIELAGNLPSEGEIWEAPISYPQNSMAMWQQQMQLMESFHNDMVVMVQMFVAMHREHVAAVAGELDMVQKLTRELGALQAQMAQSPGSATAALAAGSDGLQGETAPVHVLDSGKHETQPLADNLRGDANRTEPKSTTPEASVRATVAETPSAEGSESPVSSGASEGDSDQIYVQLTRRIAQLQRERKGYWQRILSTINK